jgi:hypothetical protein
MLRQRILPHGTDCQSSPLSVLAWLVAFCLSVPALAGTGDTNWMVEGKYGIFLHYQYRILLGYSIKTNPQFPELAQMTAEGWNRFVDSFDAKGFAEQMAQAQAGWVIFCLDDHYFAWPCAPFTTNYVRITP